MKNSLKIEFLLWSGIAMIGIGSWVLAPAAAFLVVGTILFGLGLFGALR